MLAYAITVNAVCLPLLVSHCSVLCFFMVKMNKLCAATCIHDVYTYHKSEYIPTDTNFASILVNCLYFLRKITALQASELNFRTSQVLPRKFWTNHEKMALLVMGYEECYSKFYVTPTFQALLENCHRVDLDTCVRRLVTKNGEFEDPQ